MCLGHSRLSGIISPLFAAVIAAAAPASAQSAQQPPSLQLLPSPAQPNATPPAVVLLPGRNPLVSLVPLAANNCFALRSYLFAQGNQPSEPPRLKSYSTCTPMNRSMLQPITPASSK